MATVLIRAETGGLTVKTLKVRKHQPIAKDAPLLQVIDEESKKVRMITSPKFGIVHQLLVKKDDRLTEGQVLLEIGACLHRLRLKHMCGECGMDLAKIAEEERQNFVPEISSETIAKSIALATQDSVPVQSSTGNSMDASGMQNMLPKQRVRPREDGPRPAKRAKMNGSAKTVGAEEAPKVATAFVANMPELRISGDMAKELAEKDTQRLLKSRKLVLICDLDHTLIHTTAHHRLQEGSTIPDDKVTKTFTLPRLPNQTTPQKPHTMRMRPGLQRFLSKISQKYDLYVSTLGVKVYADRVVTQINPDQKLLHKSRVLSRDDLQKACNTSFFKANNLRHLFPNGESMVLMIDDRADVWRKRKNCIHVPKYHFWKDVGDINDPHLAQDFKKTRKPGEKRPKPAKEAADEDPDDYLAILERILAHIHERFYQAYDKHQANQQRIGMPTSFGVMDHIRSHVLKDCVVMFDSQIRKEGTKRIRPLYGPNQTSPYERHSQWSGEGWWDRLTSEKLATEIIQMMGGKVWRKERHEIPDVHRTDGTEHDVAKVTHILCPVYSVAEFPMGRFCVGEKTDLLVSAEDELKELSGKRNIQILSERWLWTTYWLWQKTNEKMFRIHIEGAKKVLHRFNEFSEEVEQKDQQAANAVLSQSILDEMGKEVDDLLSSSDDENTPEVIEIDPAETPENPSQTPETIDLSGEPEIVDLSTEQLLETENSTLDDEQAVDSEQSNTQSLIEDKVEINVPSTLESDIDADTSTVAVDLTGEGSSLIHDLSISSSSGSESEAGSSGSDLDEYAALLDNI